MADLKISPGEYIVSDDPRDTLKTAPLGSSLGLAFICHGKLMAGLLHLGLANSSSAHKRNVNEIPALYADKGIPMILDELRSYGWNEELELEIKIAGGAKILPTNSIFNFSDQLIEETKRILASLNLYCSAEDLGGSVNRVLSVEVETGDVTVSSSMGEVWQL